MLCILLQAGSDASGTSDGAVYFGISRHVWAWGIGTAFALAALIISAILLIQTWLHNSVPLIRRWVMLVLLMVPVYAVFAWLGLVLKNQSPYWDLVYDCYESVAMSAQCTLLPYSVSHTASHDCSITLTCPVVLVVLPVCCRWAFFEFLTSYLGGRQHTAGILQQKPDMKHLFPFCWLPSWSMHRTFYTYNRILVLQYIPVQIITSIMIFVTSLTGNYHDGHWAVNDFYPWLALVVNVSQIFALYALIEFYQALKPELKPMKPLYKFLCIKGVVFFTFWQFEVLSGLVYAGVIGPTVTYTTSQEEYGLNDFIVCIEMFFFALAHWYAFPPREFDDSFTMPVQSMALSREEGQKTELASDQMDERTYQLREKGTSMKGTAGAAVEHKNPENNAEHANGYGGDVEMGTTGQKQEHGEQNENGGAQSAPAALEQNGQVVTSGIAHQ